MGYSSVERKINTKDAEQNFTLTLQSYLLKDVVLSSSAEDPAYAIIRNAIKKRKSYENELKKIDCNVYLKGQLQLRDYPKKFFGEKVDFEDGDTSKRKMIFLSESVAHYSREGDKTKIDVISTKVSGQKDGFGFSSPQVISFYSNYISFGSAINPRGFISPISDNALYYYKYKFRGTFYENGKEVSHIEVIPRRNYEPLFSGFINITEDDWKIQGVQLTLLKENQIQLLDTLKIEQLFVPEKNNWVIAQQVLYPAGSVFGFKFFGNFLQTYDKVNMNPSFGKNYFDNTILKFEDSANKKSLAYWDSVRPIPLLKEEIIDYKKKDSLEVVRQSPHYLDSLDKINNKITFNRIFISGQEFENRKKKTSISFQGLAKSLTSYNTVEGYVLNFTGSFNKGYVDKRQFRALANIRYGLSNHHLNANTELRYNFGSKYYKTYTLSGGTNVYQFNNHNPIDPLVNTMTTLFWTRNYMKIYESAFIGLDFAHEVGSGFAIDASIKYQNRKPLENTTDYYWSHFDDRTFTANYPTEISSSNIENHHLFSTSINIRWQPGSRYIQFPNRKMNIGSKYPVLNLTLSSGSYDLSKHVIDFAKWRFTVSDNVNFHLLGRFNYKLIAGGFLNNDKVNIIDYNHFNGNRTAIATTYMNGFQLLPYYTFSNAEKVFLEGHVEYHLNGLLTNKIPLFKKLNWFFVLAGNSLFVNPDKHYYEASFGIENILKVIRIDGVQGYIDDGSSTSGIRISIPIVSGGGK